MWKKYRHEGVIFIRDTDASGRVFCPRPIEWVIEAFEKVCLERANDAKDLAIVKAGVHFLSPLSWMDRYSLELSIIRVSNRSFDLKGEIFHGERVMVTVEITFVVSSSSNDFLMRYWQKAQENLSVGC